VQDRLSSGLVLNDMAAMTRWISARHGGQRVVVMGNCLTGAFPLALIAEKTVCAGVLCQPALPIANPSYLAIIGGCQSHETKRSLGIPLSELEAAYRALAEDRSKKLLGFHYLQDWIAPMEKFERIHEDLASRGMENRFRPVVLMPRDSQADASWWQRQTTNVTRSLNGKPHNTVTSSGNMEDRRRMRSLMLRLLRDAK
jgi:dienelactone hydrolase